jgi:peptidoglycan/LPS O-acetylase OafA/YrhL
MTDKFSAYLDVLRFTAALTVFLGHASTGYMTGGLLWQLAPYGDSCVVVFFVLSGFVISYVSQTKDTTWTAYTSNRAARLWSVVLPALLLTLCVDAVGVRVAPIIYDGPWYLGDHLALRYLASALMLQEIWHVWLVPGVNGPFWSLTYEAVYYALFGLCLFTRGKTRWVLVGLGLVLAGPLIAALFPLWLLGVFTYWLVRRIHLSVPTSALLFVAGTILLLLAPGVRTIVTHDVPVMGDPIVARYLDGLAIVMNMVGAHGLLRGNLGRRWHFATVRRVIGSVAGCTFVLYLFHRPLIQMFSFVGPADAGGWPRRLLLVGGTLALCWLATPVTERLRVRMRDAISALLARRAPLLADEEQERRSA